MRIWRKLTALFGLVALAAGQPAAAQSMLRDAETEALFADISRPIIEAAGLSPANVRVALISDTQINAFVAGGQIVYLNSGLIDAADNVNEVQGVIAHELGHVVGGHVPLQGQGARGATNISLLSLVLGAAAMAAGAGEAGMGILAAGQQVAMGTYLAFSRTQEASADAAGLRFLNGAKVSGKGMLSFFKKLQNLEYRLAIPQTNSFERSHPLTGDRIQALTQDAMDDPAWGTPIDPELEKRFLRVQAKLRGYVNGFDETMRRYPLSDQSVPAHYARAYAYHLKGYPDEAAAETRALVAADPKDPYFLELQGQILLESGKPQAALGPLREATEATRYQPLIATTFGHALLATDDRANLPEAEKVLRLAVARDGENPFAWYQLGTVYERTGDRARTALATAERANLTGDARMALASAQTAMTGLPKGSPDYIRAQDIMMVSKTQVEQERHKK